MYLRHVCTVGCIQLGRMKLKIKINNQHCNAICCDSVDSITIRIRHYIGF
jgi:hypothetical protein